MHYYYVTNKQGVSFQQGNNLSKAICLQSLNRFIQSKNESHIPNDNSNNNNNNNNIQDNTNNVYNDLSTNEPTVEYVYNDDFDPPDDILESITRSMDSTSIQREANPINEFTTDDYGISTSFPNVFMFGRVYQRSIEKLNYRQKNHLLKQFTRVPALDRCLLGYIFDTQKQFQATFGVNSYVKSNDCAMQVIQSLLDNAQEQQKLEEAIEDPNSETAEQIA